MTSNKRLWVIVSLVFIVGLFVVFSTPNKGIVKVVEEQMNEMEKPDIYNPARAAITNARMYFSDSFQPQAEIQSQTEQAHQALSEALAALEEGEGLDPSARTGITQIRNDLKLLGDTNYVTGMNAEQLRAKYQEILDRFEKLIEKY